MQVRDQNRYSNKFINLLLLFFNFFVKEENQYLFFYYVLVNFKYR